ncbi:MAG: indolepyruvate oxidoreductase subunit beta [Lachnospiraceae bacterium]|nr:indolepyruvate oxidoreductase subunit beta [Lachnospiraceae bacterium]MBP5254915.1 indolepyruvate oxidoreductase subunit beta [Lachnospiraceae bacterium]
MSVNIMICGVGGQGTLLASRVIGRVFLQCGDDVKISEVHGMSQRGGSVVTYVRAGRKVYSPVIKQGEADFILSFEKLEAARYIEMLKADGTVVTNTQEIASMPVITGAAVYPGDVLDTLRAAGIRVDALDALALAREAGTERAVNVVLLGHLSRYFDFPENVWTDALKETVKPAFLEMNLKAFALGRGN